MAEDKQHKTLRYLEDAYAAENGGLTALKALADATTDSDLRSALTAHAQETQGHIAKLETRITALGGKPSAGKSMVDNIVAIGSHLSNAMHDKADKQTQDTIKTLSFEAFEIGAYTALNAYAQEVGDSETASLATSILSEEQSAYDKVLKLLPQVATSATYAAA